MTRAVEGIRIIKDPEVAKLIADDTRRRILHMLLHQEMSPADLAKALDKNFSSIHHHLCTLLAAGLIEQTREEKVRNMVQPYYRATAHRFIISYSLTESLAKDDGYAQWHEDSLQKMINGLEVFGIKIPDDKRARVAELMDSCVEMERKAIEGAIEQQSDPSKLDRDIHRPLLQLLAHLKLSRDPEYAEAIRELDKLIGP
jgi:DNA-binding transcriptional ArsR family regulator